jgi:hypothetical protein
MRYFSTLMFIAAITFKASSAYAQQAKAYENVTYTAKSGSAVFNLHYADGYLAASKIVLQKPKQKVQVFLPQSGVPEAHGDLIFQGQNKVDEARVILHRIGDAAEPSKSIGATYHLNGRAIGLQFKMK